MTEIAIEGYLTQPKLAAALKQVVGESWIGEEVAVAAGSRRKWDMAYRSAGGTVVVEYDGDPHYWNSIRMKIDREKDKAAADLGYRVVRFPYWIQLTSETLRHFFGLSAEIRQDFPHGFITTKIFPASFCEMGVERFVRELRDLPSGVRLAVVQSLRDRAQEHGVEYVLPSKLRYLVES
jgi:hypothetical protein